MLPSLTASDALTVRDFTLFGGSFGRYTGTLGQTPPPRYLCPPFCPPGEQCTHEIGLQAYNRYGCCAPGETLCQGQCMTCPGKQRPDIVNCDCGCVGGDPGCVYGTVWDPINCLCACPTDPCPDYRMTRDAVCDCVCPSPLVDCNGYCADLRHDQDFCGDCNTMCDVFTEKCCDGTCTNICTDTDCGDCGIKVGAGQKCCLSPYGYCTGTTLGTNTNCADCGDVCTGGRVCVNGQCQCPSTSRACASGGDCCPNSRDCCGGTCCSSGLSCCGTNCVNLQIDDDHCGDCTTKCPPNQTCSGGKCVCPPGTQLIDTCCCPAGQGCCDDGSGNKVCTSLTTVDHCGDCQSNCQYYDPNGDFVGTGSCDPATRTCRCPPGMYQGGVDARGDYLCCDHPGMHYCNHQCQWSPC